MEIHTILEDAKAAMGPDRVFGEPIERDGVTVVPVAKVAGGGGGGGDDGDAGGGFGVAARPAGALVVERDGTVRWKRHVDIDRVLLGGQLVAVAFFFFVWLTERSRARAAAKATVGQARAAGGGS